MSDEMTMTRTQFDAFESLIALEELEYRNGMKTTRAQNAVLQVLSDSDIAVVAVALKRALHSHQIKVQ